MSGSFHPKVLGLTVALLIINLSFVFAMPPHPDLEPGLKVQAVEVYLRAKARWPQLNAPGPLLQPMGTYRAIVLLVDFSDNIGQESKTLYEDLLFSLGTYPTGSMRDYYKEISYNQFDVIGDVNGTHVAPNWYRMPETYGYYTNGDYGWGSYPRNAQKLAEVAVVAADPYVDYTRYDNDQDGLVDSLFILHAGPGAEVTGDLNDIWSRRWVMRNPPVLDGMNFRGYSMEPEYTWILGDSTIGVFAHEYGHDLGLPDLYDTGGAGEGIGRWGLMGTGSWNGGGTRPAHPCAWSKIQWNWVVPVTISDDQTGVNIPRVEDNQSIFRLWTGGATGTQYFLVENRQRTLFDDNLPGDGLLIYHVDDSVLEQDNPDHYKVDVEQADGNFDLNDRLNRGDDGDPWPGSSVNTTFDVNSTPNSRNYNRRNTSVAVTSISSSAPTMTADFFVEPTWNSVYGRVFDSPSDLVLFRAYRDQFLTKTFKGNFYTHWLYSISVKASEVLLNNPDMMLEAKYLIATNKQAVSSVLDGSEGIIYNTDEIVDFLDGYAKKAPPALKVLAKIVQWDMLRKKRRGDLFLGFRLK
jgi:immune inhibitor A